VGLLQRDVTSGRVAHAYLFSGAAGRLPLDTALAFGAALVCPSGGCGECEACTRVVHHAHPDVEILEPAGMQLLVEQVREAIRAASRRPVAGPRRVIVVEGADRMNPTAQNAFLKTLEEPPSSTTIVLLAPNPEALLETVRSRCREVIFRSPAENEVADLLVEAGADAEDAARFARTGGSLERASTLAQDPEAKALRDEVVRRVLARPRDPGDSLEHAEWLASQTKGLRERVAATHERTREEHEAWYRETKRLSDERLRREQRRAEQDALDAAADDIASVLRDLLVSRVDPDARLLNPEVRKEIAERAESLGVGAEARIIACLRDVERCRRRLRANANVLLTLEEMFLSLFRHLGVL
jgi:DNA polymerase-3 subunit delta'